MKKIVLIYLVSFSLASFAQKSEEKKVMKVVNQVFEAMKTNDSTLLKLSFVENPNMFTVSTNKEGMTSLTSGDFQRFKDAIGSPKKQQWSEPIWNEQVAIDGNLASVWVDYAFYAGDQFSHCGVDAFHLVKMKDKWKIFHLVDTRRRSDCEVPEHLKP